MKNIISSTIRPLLRAAQCRLPVYHRNLTSKSRPPTGGEKEKPTPQDPRQTQKGHDGGEGRGRDGDDDGDDDADGFGLEDFVTHDISEDTSVEEIVEKLDDKELTPELATDVVARMVDAQTRSLQARTSISGKVLASITPHTVSVLRASRISTNTVHASGTGFERYPIERRVTATLSVPQLALSEPARHALLILSGPRLRDDDCSIYISCDRYPSKEENHAYVVTRLHRLVLEAKAAVGESVDLTPLDGWDDVVREVQRQATKEVEEAGGVYQALGIVEGDDEAERQRKQLASSEPRY